MENSSIGIAIRKVVALEGEIILLNPKRFCAILDDLAVESRKESKIIRRGINDEVLKMLYEISNSPASEIAKKLSRLEYYLQNERGLSSEWSGCIISAFSDAFAWQYQPSNISNSESVAPSRSTIATIEKSSNLNTYENTIVLGFMDFELGKLESAQKIFRQILMQDITCAEAYLGMFLVSNENEQFIYAQKFIQYASDQISKLECQLITDKNKEAILKFYLKIKDYGRIAAVLPRYGTISGEFFCEAIVQDPCLQLVTLFLNNGFNKNCMISEQYSDGSGSAPVISHLMSKNVDTQVISILLDCGFNPNAERIFHSSVGFTNHFCLLSDSIWRSKNARYTDILLRSGANVHTIEKSHYVDGSYEEKSMLHLAILENNFEMVQMLIQHGADTQVSRLRRSKYGDEYYSALSDSVWKKPNIKIAEILLKHGADVNYINKVSCSDGTYAEKSLLTEAVLVDNIAMVRLLVSHGADVNFCRLRRSQYGDEYYSILSDSVWYTGNTEVAEFLIQNGADVNYVNKVHSENGTYGEKPLLSEAVINNNFKMVQLLLSHGADPNSVRLYRCNEYDEYISALGECIWSLKNVDLLELLLQNGGDASKYDEKHFHSGRLEKNCLLHYAIEYAKSKEMILLLLDHGASIDDPVTYKGKHIPIKQYPYQCGYPLNSTLEKIGWKGHKRFVFF